MSFRAGEDQLEGILPSVIRASNYTDRDWVIGGGDTCQGDSGGPLIKKMGKVSVLVGVVSRGTRCGRLDQAGIYIREEQLTFIMKEQGDQNSIIVRADKNYFNLPFYYLQN